MIKWSFLVDFKRQNELKVKMYKYNIYFLTKMGNIQNIHTALVSILQISHAKRYNTKDVKNYVVEV